MDCKSMNSFLYNWDLRHERVGKKTKSQNILIHLPGSVLEKKMSSEKIRKTTV